MPEFKYSFLYLHSTTFPSSSLPVGFSDLGDGWCVRTAGCMIRPGRLVILASSRERYDIYFSNPRPWGWKMHVSSLAKAIWVIIYASVCPVLCLDLSARCLTGDAWCLTLTLLPPALLLSTCPLRQPTSRGHHQCAAPLISTCQVQTLTWSHLTIRSFLCSPYIWLLALPQNVFLSLLYEHIQLLVICKDMCYQWHVTWV